MELQHLFAQMLLLNKESVSTSDLTDSFGWTGNQVIYHVILHSYKAMLGINDDGGDK